MKKDYRTVFIFIMSIIMLIVMWLIMQKGFLSKMNLFYFNRKVMLYGALSVLPIVLLKGDSWHFEQIANIPSVLSLMYLGILASGICYVMWSKAFATLGTVHQQLSVHNSIYIYDSRCGSA